MRFWPSFFLAGCLCSMAAGSHAQVPNSEPQSTAPVESNPAPKIDKVDPPDWFAGLPSPMLLLHGEGFKGVHFAVAGSGVTLSRTQVSDNGHWAFLWLDAKSAAPQTVTLTATGASGSATRKYVFASRTLNPGAHRGFSSADVLYLIMTDRFAHAGAAAPRGDDRSLPHGWHGGNLDGIAQHIDYLKQLGVTAVWTTPVASNGAMPDSYHGYAATDLYAVDPHFGTLDDYRHLSSELHAHGMKLVIDLVPNHVGVQHPWVKDPPAPGWFHGSLAHHPAVEADFYLLVDPHAAPAAWRNIVDGWFTDQMPDLNQSNPLVSQYLIQNALWWIETAYLDGIRLDTFPYVDRSFWHDYDAALHSVYPYLTTVGEIFHRDPEVTSYFAGGATHQGIDTGLYTPFDFPVYFTLRDVLAHGKPMTDLADVLRQDSLYPHPERLVSFIGNHDTVRFLTESKGSVSKLKLALGLIITLRGTPQIYSGDEIGMTGDGDPDNRHDFPGGFAGDAHTAFIKAGRTATEEDVFSWTASLLALRAAHSTLQTGLEQNLLADESVFAFVRSADGLGCAPEHSKERLLIVVNKAEKSRQIQLPVEETALAGCVAFVPMQPTVGVVAKAGGGKLQIDEPAESMTVYAVR